MSHSLLSQFQEDRDDADARWWFLTRWVHAPRRERGDTSAAVIWHLAGRAAALAFLAIAVFLPSLSANFLDSEAGPLSHASPPWARAGGIIESAQIARNHIRTWPTPLVQALCAMENPVAGSAVAYHAVSVALHALTTVLLWMLLRRLRCPAAWLAAAIFAVSPTAVETVALIDNQSRVWAAGLACAGLLLLLGPLVSSSAAEEATFVDDEDAAPGHLSRGARLAVKVLGGILLVAATLCQPAAAMVSLVAVLLIVWQKKLTGVGWIGCGMLVIASGTAGAISASPAAILAVFNASGHWLVMGEVAIGVLLFAAVLFLFRSRWSVGPAVAAICLLLLLPTVIAPPAFHLPFDRSAVAESNRGETYLLLIPVWTLLATGLVWITARIRNAASQSLVQLAVGMAIVLSAGATTFALGLPYRSTEEVLLDRVAANPASQSDRSRLADWYLAHNKPDLAAAQLSTITPANCTSAAAAVSAGDLQRVTGHVDQAADWYRVAQKIDPNELEGFDRLATLFAAQGKVDQAIDSYRTTLRRHPEALNLRNNLGLLLLGENQPTLAAEQFSLALKTDPDFVPAHVNLATAYIQQGKLVDAAGELNKAVQLDPQNADSYHNAGVVLAQLHDAVDAKNMLQTAVRLRPDWPEARNDLGVVLVGSGQFKQAEYEFEQAIQLNPKYDAARHNLSVARRRASTRATTTPAT